MTAGTGTFRMMTDRVGRPLYLRTIAGPLTLELQASPDRASTIGRDPTADLQLDHPTVSRHHARLALLGGQWTITDLGSHNGTVLCGQLLAKNQPTPVHPGDDLTIGTCILRVVGSERSPMSAPLALTGAEGDLIAQRGEEDLVPAGIDQMRRLADAALSIGGCGTLLEVAEQAVKELIAGSRFENVVFIEATPDLALAGALVSKSRTEGQEGPVPVSRSLLLAALRLTQGKRIVSLADRPEGQWGASIMNLAIASAVAAPIFADGRMIGVLYGDTRRGGGPAAAARDSDASFVLGLAQICALAVSRLQGADIRRRMQDVEKELKAARRAQRAILPSTEGRVGLVQYASLFIPGAHVAGDFFDVVAMPDGRVACVLGDVCGHGMAAGLFMASLLTHLRDQLSRGVPAAAAVDSANRLMAALNESDEPSESLTFATLFLAVVDAAGRRVECVDRGHGYAAIVRGGATPRAELIQADGAMPLGVDISQSSTAVELPMGPDDGLFLFSDGVVEQSGGPERSQFEIARVLECLSRATEMKARLSALHLALATHAGVDQSATFQDDVTILGAVMGRE